MKESPTISVVTPSYNQAAFLERTIQSVLQQDYPSVEYIVLDGGSTDESPEIIKRYSDKLAYWKSGPDKGQADAIATGFEIATGDILCWLNSDDLFLPGALRAVAQFFASNPCEEAVSGGALVIDAVGRLKKVGFGYITLGVAASYDRLRYYGQDGVFQPATFWRRNAYEAVGGLDRTFQFIMDRDLFARLARRRPFARLPAFLAAFRLHEDSKSTRIQQVRVKETEKFNFAHDVLKTPTAVRHMHYWRFRLPSLLRKAYWVLRYQKDLDRVLSTCSSK